MGLEPETIRLAARLLRDRKLSGRAITFGVQRVDASLPEARALLAAEGFPFREPSGAVLARGQIHQDVLFEMLGFDAVESVDRYPDERPSRVLDLNEPIPDDMRERYDLVCDSGTLEHCFDVPQVLENVVRLLAWGGHVLHATPISGWLQHAFYQISPNLYFDFYRANGFDELGAKVFFDGRVVDLRDLTRRDFLGHKAQLVFVARKRESRAEIAIPIQSEYRAKYGGEEALGFGDAADRIPDPGHRAIFDPRSLARDVAVIAKRYFRLAWSARVLPRAKPPADG